MIEPAVAVVLFALGGGIAAVKHRYRRRPYADVLASIARLERELFPPPRVFGRIRIPGTSMEIIHFAASATRFEPGRIWQVDDHAAIRVLQNYQQIIRSPYSQ